MLQYIGSFFKTESWKRKKEQLKSLWSPQWESHHHHNILRHAYLSCCSLSRILPPSPNLFYLWIEIFISILGLLWEKKCLRIIRFFFEDFLKFGSYDLLRLSSDFGLEITYSMVLETPKLQEPVLKCKPKNCQAQVLVQFKF